MPEHYPAKYGDHCVIGELVNDNNVEMSAEPRRDSVPCAGRTHATHQL